MFIKLTKNEYCNAFHLYKGIQFELLLNSIIENKTLAKIWVDDKDEPKSAFLWDQANNVFYLSGDVSNLEFNNQLRECIKTQITSEARKNGNIYFKIQITSEEWASKLDFLFNEIKLIHGKRNFYKIDETKHKKLNISIPQKYNLEKIDAEFLERTDIKFLNIIKEEIQCMWPSIQDFIHNGYGFSLIDDKEVVAWCTAEFMSTKRCGIGIETNEKFQNKGFATLIASKFIEYCLGKGIVPHWDCAAENIGSNRVAEKVGFEKVLEYTVLYGRF